MNGHKQLNLIIAIILFPAAIVWPIPAATPAETNSLLPETLQGIPGATADWWASVQDYFRQSEYLETRQMAGITGLSLLPNWGDEGDQEDAQFGFSVASAGDVNDDGYADVIVGAPFYDQGQTDEGAAAVYYGSAAGLALLPAWLSEGDQENAHFGLSVGTAGDVNGDGYADVIVGAPGYDHGQDGEGVAFVYHGSATGLSLTPNWLSESNQVGAEFGTAVGTAGDVNGDGYADVIVGARLYDNGQTDEGAAAVYHGSAAGLSITAAWMDESNQDYAEFGSPVDTAGDVNGDGYDDVIIGAPWYDHGQADEGAVAVYYGSATGLSLVPNWGDEGDQNTALLGQSVGTAGDVNGDGYADIIVGASWYDNGQTNEGAAAVYYGSAAGLSLVPSWLGEGDREGAHFGGSVGTAGDVNGDGYADVIVGAPSYTNDQTNEGTAFVYHGSAAGLALIPSWLDESDQEFAYFGGSVGTAGDVNGDGYDDVIVGARYYDHGQADEGAAVVYHGGEDTVIYNHIYLPLAVRDH